MTETKPSDWSTVAAMCPVYLYLNRDSFKSNDGKRKFFPVIIIDGLAL